MPSAESCSRPFSPRRSFTMDKNPSLVAPASDSPGHLAARNSDANPDCVALSVEVQRSNSTAEINHDAYCDTVTSG